MFKAISGPLFAVVVLASAFVVSREDRRDVAEVKDIASVTASFAAFLDWLPRKLSSVNPPRRDALICRLDRVRSISHNLGYGVGDDLDSMFAKYSKHDV